MPLTTAASLKAATAIPHSEAERILIAKLAGIRSLHQHAIVETFYRYFFPLQQIIARHISRDGLPDTHERRQALLLLRNRESSAIPASGTKLCTLLPTVENKARAYGQEVTKASVPWKSEELEAAEQFRNFVEFSFNKT